MAGKKYQEIKEKITPQTATLEEAISFLKENPGAAFDETIELHVHLGIDPQKSDQMVKASVTLPSGTVQPKKIIVFTEDKAKQRLATEAGAHQAGGAELIDEIASAGSLAADSTVATPEIMSKIAKIAKILGPQGLMPNPKTGTVTADPATIVKELMSGKIFFKMDQLGNIHEAIGKRSWEANKIVLNATALLDALRAARPISAKGQFIRSITLKSTMSPAIRVAA